MILLNCYHIWDHQRVPEMTHREHRTQIQITAIQRPQTIKPQQVPIAIMMICWHCLNNGQQLTVWFLSINGAVVRGTLSRKRGLVSDNSSSLLSLASCMTDLQCWGSNWAWTRVYGIYTEHQLAWTWCYIYFVTLLRVHLLSLNQFVH